MVDTFTFHADPGHGWLRVLAADLTNLGLSFRDFSRYSYTSGHNIYYLEEDRDAPKFIEAYRAKHGRAPEFREEHTNASSFIRLLAPIHNIERR